MPDTVDPIEDDEFIVFNAALSDVAKAGDVGYLLQLHDDLAEAEASDDFINAVSCALVEAIGKIAESANVHHTDVVDLLVERLTGKARPNEDEVEPVVEHFEAELYPLSPQVYIEGMKLMAVSFAESAPYLAEILDKRDLAPEVYVEGLELLSEKDAFEEIEVILERDTSKENHGDIRYEERGKILERLIELDLNDVADGDNEYAVIFTAILQHYADTEVQARINQGGLPPDVDREAAANQLAPQLYPQIKESLKNDLATLSREQVLHSYIEQKVEDHLAERVEREKLDESVYLKGMELLAKGGKSGVLANMHARGDVSERVKTEAIRLLRADLGHLRSKDVLSTALSTLKANRPRPPAGTVVPIRPTR